MITGSLLSDGRGHGSINHLTEMGNHRVGSGNSSRLPRCAAAPDQDGWEIGPWWWVLKSPVECGATVGQERPPGKPGRPFSVFPFSRQECSREIMMRTG